MPEDPSTDEPATAAEATGAEVTDAEVADAEVTDAEVADTEVTDAEATDAEATDAEATAAEPTDTVAPLSAEDVSDLLAALPLARAALAEITPESTIGEPIGHVVESAGAVSLQFAAALPGYPGWHWTVTVGRADDDAEPTVLEAPPSLTKLNRKPADDMAIIVEDLVKLLDGIGSNLRRGKYPDKAHGAKIAAVLRKVADDLDA